MALRRAIRSGEFSGSTAGLIPDRCQVNYVGLPHALAEDFHEYCLNNPKPCPLIEMTPPGASAPASAPGCDLRTDIPRYRVYREGKLVSEPLSLDGDWRDDIVSFLLGCSFSFEASLRHAGIPLRHQEQGTTVPMYRTNRETKPTAYFAGPLVVSMRPIPADMVSRAVEITAAQPWAHGAPVAVGRPDTLGIADLDRPDFGDPVHIGEREVPVFWACGVTPQTAAQDAARRFMVTHAPGRMLITDLPTAGGPWDSRGP